MIQKTDKSRLLQSGAAPSASDALLCAPDETAVVMKAGAVVATHGPGLHALTDPETRVFVVRTSRVDGLRGAGAVGDVKDDPTGLDVPLQASFEAAVRVVDPRALVASAGGFGADPEAELRRWIVGRILDAVRVAVGGHTAVAAAVASATTVAARVVASGVPDLKGAGIELVALGSLALTAPADDLAKVRSAMGAIRTAPPPPPPASAPRPSLGPGSRVLVPWNDGQRYPGTVRRFLNGYFEVAWDSGTGTVWLLPQQLVPR